MKMKVTYLSGGADRELGLWNLTDVTIQGDQYPNIFILKNDEVFVPYNERTMSLGANVFTMPEIHTEQTRTITTPVFFFIYNTDNYFHYLYDSLPILYQFFELRKRYPDLQVLIKPAHNYPYILDCLRTLGINDVVIAERGHLYTSMWISSSLTHDGQSNSPPHPGAWSIFNRMKSQTPPKIYVSRRSWIHGDTSNMGTNYTTRRKMMVEDQLVESLTSVGYTEVFCEQLSMEEKIRYFSNATHVIGAIGGGMCNLVFAAPSCRVTSINSPEFAEINKRFFFTMNHTQLTQYTKTWSVSNLYRRVRIGDKIGEISKIDGSELTIQVGQGVGWTLNDTYDTLVVNESEVVFLDNGLNSPWSFDVLDFMNFIQ